MSRYAETTSVSSEKSRSEIERTLERYGADGFMYGWEGRNVTIMFRMKSRMIRFFIEMPDKSNDEFMLTPSRGNIRSTDAALKAWEQACRQRWRALALVIKAKLEAVEAGISEFEEEFLAHIVLPDGQTVGQYMLPQVATVYETGRMPKLLPGSGRIGEYDREVKEQ